MYVTKKRSNTLLRTYHTQETGPHINTKKSVDTTHNANFKQTKLKVFQKVIKYSWVFDILVCKCIFSIKTQGKEKYIIEHIYTKIQSEKFPSIMAFILLKWWLQNSNSSVWEYLLITEEKNSFTKAYSPIICSRNHVLVVY